MKTKKRPALAGDIGLLFADEAIGLHQVWLIFALLAFGSPFCFTGLITTVPTAAAAGVIRRSAG